MPERQRQGYENVSRTLGQTDACVPDTDAPLQKRCFWALLQNKKCTEPGSFSKLSLRLCRDLGVNHKTLSKMQSSERAAKPADNKDEIGHGNGQLIAITCTVHERTPNRHTVVAYMHGVCLRQDKSEETHLKYLPSFSLNIYMPIYMGTTLIETGKGLCSPVAPSSFCPPVPSEATLKPLVL